MIEKEILHFKIGLSSSTSRKSPEFIIRINDKEFINSKLNEDFKTTQYFEFDAELDEGPNNLEIEFLNKLDEDFVKEVKGNNQIELIDDLLLNIDSIEIDEIELATLKWSKSIYKPIYSEDYVKWCKRNKVELKEEVLNCVNLGWKGSWNLPFESPLYVWLIENI